MLWMLLWMLLMLLRMDDGLAGLHVGMLVGRITRMSDGLVLVLHLVMRWRMWWYMGRLRRQS